MTISRLRNGWFALIGALAYWLPDLLIHQFDFDFDLRIYFLLLTIAPPTVVLAAYFFARPRFPQHLYALPLFMLLGIWASGPLGIAAGMVPHGGTFLEAYNLPKFFTLWAIFPLSTWTMSAYSGSLGGVFVVTIALLFAAVLARRNPPAS